MRRRSDWVTAAILLGFLGTASARGEVPESFRRMWSDREVVSRIERDTEQYRKADAVIHVVDAQGQPIRDAKVAARQQTHEFLFGCNLFVLGQLATPELNAKYEEAFARLFNFATLPFYWGDLEPEQGQPRFAKGSKYIWRRPPPDELLAWCQGHGITPKGHALLYVKNMFMPEWTVRDDPKAFMEQARRHMVELAGRYGDRIPVWDVINEEIPRVASPAEWHAVGDDYAVECFQEASRLFPDQVKLLINDGTTQTHVTLDECEANVKKVLDRGADGIGIQFHTSRSALASEKLYPPKRMIEVYDRLGGLGLSLYITEITIPGAGQDGAAFQAEAAAQLYRLWFSTPKMAGITWWNLGDGTAFGNENNALGGLVDKDMNPKPAYEALDRLINHEWKTSTEGTTGAGGDFAFRGFKGGYQVAVEAAGKTREFTIVVADGGIPQKLVFDAR